MNVHIYIIYGKSRISSRDPQAHRKRRNIFIYFLGRKCLWYENNGFSVDKTNNDFFRALKTLYTVLCIYIFIIYYIYTPFKSVQHDKYPTAEFRNMWKVFHVLLRHNLNSKQIQFYRCVMELKKYNNNEYQPNILSCFIFREYFSTSTKFST